MTKLKNINCDNSKTYVVTTLIYLIWEKDLKLKLLQNSTNLDCEKTQISTKLKNSNSDKTKKNSNIDKIQILMTQNSKLKFKLNLISSRTNLLQISKSLLIRTTDELYSDQHFVISQSFLYI